MTRRVVGLFDSADQAQRARDELVQAGFSASGMQVVNKAGVKEDESFWDKVRDFFGFSDTSYYEEATQRGGTLLMADVPEERVDNAVAIMNRHNPIDVTRRAEEWTKAGWKAPAAATTPAHKGETVVPVVEEQVNVGKRREERGGVRIYSHVVEKPVHENVRLHEEHVNVERRPADRPAGPDAFRERTIEATEAREVPVVNKEARVVGEVVVNKDVRERNEAVNDTVRRTDVDVQRLDEEFHKDFDTNFARTGSTWEQYRPAYQYGRDLALDQRYRDRDWTTIEPEAQVAFERTNPGKWTQFRDAVHRGYDRARLSARPAARA